MRIVLTVMVAAFACLMPCPAKADVEQMRAAMKTARWTGPMLASTAETLPRGHFYTEPYFFDVIVAGDHHPGSSGFYQYGLLDNLTVGFQPSFATDTNRLGRGMAIGDFKLLSQLRLTHFTPEHRVPTIALVLNEVIPTGKFDRLRPAEEGHGSGAFANSTCMNVPPVNSMFQFTALPVRARCTPSSAIPIRMNAIVAPAAVRQYLMKSYLVS